MTARIDLAPLIPQQVSTDSSGPGNEFPTLDLDGEDMGPPVPAVHLPVIEKRELPALLAKYLPGVVHAHRRHDWGDEHQFICTLTGAAVRYCLHLDARREVRATVAETGTGHLWDRIVIMCSEWNHAGRPPVEVSSHS